MAKKLNQSQRRKLRKVKAAAANLTGPPAAPTTGQRDARIHRTQPAARGRQSGVRKQIEMVVRHYHFYQQAVAGCTFIPPNIIGGQDMSTPPPSTVLLNSEVVQGHPQVVQSHPTNSTPKKGHSSSKGQKEPQHPSVLRANKTVARVSSGKPVLTLWGSSHLATNQLLGPDLEVKLEAHFQTVINLSEGGAKLTDEMTKRMETEIRSHPGPNQVYVILTGGNNMRKTTRPVVEVAKLVSRFRRIMVEAQKAKTRILLCGTIPDPRHAVDSKLKLLDAALKDLDMGQGNNFLSMRATMLDARGQVRKDLYKPNGDVHLNSSGTKIASLRIRNMLEVMLPAIFPVQAQVQAPAPVVVNTPPVVNVPLVAPNVVNAPAGVQQLVGQLQDLVVQHVTIAPVAMEVENDNEILKRLFLQKFGRALPEVEVEVDLNMDLIDLTKEDEDEMEVATSEVVQVVVKTEVPEAAPVDDRRRSSRLGRLRKTNVIQEKEAPLAAGTANVIADNDTDMAEDVSNVNTVNTESGKTYEQIMADIDAAIEDNTG